MNRVLGSLLLILVVTGCTNLDSMQGIEKGKESQGAPSKEVVLTPTIIATDLEIPWTIAPFQGTIYVTERVGDLSEIDKVTGDIRNQKLRLKRKVLHEGEGGLLGFTLAPDFQTSQRAFAYHTYEEAGEVFNRVIVLEKNGDIWTEVEALLERIPGGRIHNGGRIRIGPDSKLYVTTGDAGVPDNSQDLGKVAGKILRMNLDGSIPNNNPFRNSYVYSYGHRNPQGLAWDEEGILYSTEHGQSAHDEINRIQPGKNYGWPIIEGDQEAPNMIKPLFHTGDYTWAPSGIDYANGKLFIATLRDSKIRSYDLESEEIEVVLDVNSRMRDVLIEQGTLFTITNNRDGRGYPQAGDDKLLALTNLGIKR
ncbi:PQQ-dependent sugar dehydrogenase [Fredinandcohnia humi]